MDSKVIANWLMPLSKKLRTVSISLVKREMTLPEVYRSWNDTLSDCAWRNTRLRRYTTTPSDTRTVYATLTHEKIAVTAVAATKNTSRVSRGETSPCLSGSMELSRTRAIRIGAIAEEPETKSTEIIDRANAPRCGRNIWRNSAIERSRVSARSCGLICSRGSAGR